MNKRELYYRTYSKVRKDIKAYGFTATMNNPEIFALPGDVGMGISHAVGAFYMPEPFKVTASEHLARYRAAKMWNKHIAFRPRFKSYQGSSDRLP